MKPKIHLLGELRSELENLLKRPDDTQVFFGAGDLRLYRLKDRGPVEGPGMVQFEFNEVYAVAIDPAVDGD